MTKKIIYAMLLVFAVLLAPMAFADETEENNTMDVDIMQTPYGIELKILHLKEALDVSINNANALIEKVALKNLSTDDLESKLAEFEALKDEANNLIASDSNIVSKIITIKQSAINITNEIKTLSKEKLTNDERTALLKEFAETKKQVRDEYKAQIKEKVENLNQQRLINFMENHGIINEIIKQKLLSKEITPADALKMLKDNVKKMPQKNKEKLKQKVIEEASKRKILEKAVKEKVEDRKKAHIKLIKENAKLKEQLIKEKIKNNLVSKRLEIAKEIRNEKLDKRLEIAKEIRNEKLDKRLEIAKEIRNERLDKVQENNSN